MRLQLWNSPNLFVSPAILAARSTWLLFIKPVKPSTIFSIKPSFFTKEGRSISVQATKQNSISSTWDGSVQQDRQQEISLLQSPILQSVKHDKDSRRRYLALPTNSSNTGSNHHNIRT